MCLWARTRLCLRVGLPRFDSERVLGDPKLRQFFCRNCCFCLELTKLFRLRFLPGRLFWGPVTGIVTVGKLKEDITRAKLESFSHFYSKQGKNNSNPRARGMATFYLLVHLRGMGERGGGEQCE